jgi:predicted transcriptional regulator
MTLCSSVTLLFVRVTIDFPDDLHQRLKAIAANENSTLKALVGRALKREIEPYAPLFEAIEEVVLTQTARAVRQNPTVETPCSWGRPAAASQPPP